jgi:hypothetical protein
MLLVKRVIFSYVLTINALLVIYSALTQPDFTSLLIHEYLSRVRSIIYYKEFFEFICCDTGIEFTGYGY